MQFTAGELRHLRGTPRHDEADMMFKRILAQSVLDECAEDMQDDEVNGHEREHPLDAGVRRASNDLESVSHYGVAATTLPTAGGGRHPRQTNAPSAYNGVRSSSTTMGEAQMAKGEPSLAEGIAEMGTASKRRRHSLRGESRKQSNGTSLTNCDEKGHPDESSANARRAKWLLAVEENDNCLKEEQKRLALMEDRVREQHTARSIELMKWMVNEQSGKHGALGREGPPPMQ